MLNYTGYGKANEIYFEMSSRKKFALNCNLHDNYNLRTALCYYLCSFAFIIYYFYWMEVLKAIIIR